MNKIFLALAASAMAAPAAFAAAPAAQSVSAFSTADAYSFESGYQNRRERAYERGYREGRRDERVGSNTRVWRGEDGRTYCRRKNGTTGLLIGGAVGGLAGNEIAGRGDKTLGTIIGVAGGALLGREIDKGRLTLPLDYNSAGCPSPCRFGWAPLVNSSGALFLVK